MWRDLCDTRASCSKDNEKGKGIASTPLQSDPFVGKDQQRLNIRPREESESTGLVYSFLQSFLELLRDDCALLEMQNLIDKCEQPISRVVANRGVHHIKKYVWNGREMRLSSQIGYYDMDEAMLYLGSEVNVLTKKTWELMGKPKLRYSPTELRLSNQ